MFNCTLCLAPSYNRHYFCRACLADIAWNQQSCPHCAEPVATNQVCQQCNDHEPSVDLCLAPMLYRFPISQVILRSKQGTRADLLIPLSRILCEHIRQTERRLPKLLIPVPAAPSTARQRGYNQSGIIARLLGRSLKIPVAYELVNKIRDTGQQKHKDRQQRQQNLQRSFRVNRQQLDRFGAIVEHVALVDDVITTGATLNQIAKQLRYLGVERIEGWALAKTPKT